MRLQHFLFAIEFIHVPSSHTGKQRDISPSKQRWNEPGWTNHGGRHSKKLPFRHWRSSGGTWADWISEKFKMLASVITKRALNNIFVDIFSLFFVCRTKKICWHCGKMVFIHREVVYRYRIQYIQKWSLNSVGNKLHLIRKNWRSL